MRVATALCLASNPRSIPHIVVECTSALWKKRGHVPEVMGKAIYQNVTRAFN